jgi:predicted ATPase
MPYLQSLNVNADKNHPFPFDVPAIKFAKNLDLSAPVNYFIGDNGIGKSNLLEAIAFRLQLLHIDGSDYSKRAFEAAKEVVKHLELTFKIDLPIGFFFRPEDFGDFINSVHRTDAVLHERLATLEGEIPDHILQEMKDNANFQLYHIRKNYGQELNSFSHGEAYLKIIQEKIELGGFLS